VKLRTTYAQLLAEEPEESIKRAQTQLFMTLAN
jgi:hypothetical protein